MKASRLIAYSAVAVIVVSCAALPKGPEVSNENTKRGLFFDLIELCFSECSRDVHQYHPQSTSGNPRSPGGEEPRVSAEEVTLIFENTKKELKAMKKKLKKRDDYDNLSLEDKGKAVCKAISRWNACLREFQQIGHDGFATLIASTKEEKVAKIEESQANLMEEFYHVRALILDMSRKYEIASGAVSPSAPIIIG